MLAAVIHAPSDIRVAEVPDPSVKDAGDAFVRVNICRRDVPEDMPR